VEVDNAAPEGIGCLDDLDVRDSDLGGKRLVGQPGVSSEDWRRVEAECRG